MSAAPVPPDGETPQNRRDLEAREDWRAARVDAINRGDLSFDRGFISGLTAGRAAATPDPPDDEGWSPGVDDPEPPALGDIDTGEGWYQT